MRRADSGDSRDAVDHLIDRLSQDAFSVFGAADCEKCIVLSREIGVVKYAGPFERSRTRRANGKGGRGREVVDHGRREREG